MIAVLRHRIVWSRHLSLFGNAYEYATLVIPSVIIAPRYFAGQVTTLPLLLIFRGQIESELCSLGRQSVLRLALTSFLIFLPNSSLDCVCCFQKRRLMHKASSLLSRSASCLFHTRSHLGSLSRFTSPAFGFDERVLARFSSDRVNYAHLILSISPWLLPSPLRTHTQLLPLLFVDPVKPHQIKPH